jgi:hypothetical protein
VVTWTELKKATEGMPRSDAYREASRLVELRVRQLAPKGDPNHGGLAPRTPTRGPRMGPDSVMMPDPPSLVGSALIGEEEQS